MSSDKRSKQWGPNSQYDVIRKKINNKYMKLEMHKTPLDLAATSKGWWPVKTKPTSGLKI